MAIGAGRAQLVQQWLTEAVILGVLGAAGGLIVARWGTPILYGFGIPEGVDLSLSGRVFAFTLVTGVGTGLIFGLAPVFQLMRRDTLTALRGEGGAVATGARATRLRSTFVVLQVALSLVLLVGAGLFLRTVQRAYAVDLGYRVDRMLVAEISPGISYTPEAGQALYAELLGRLEALPGVAGAGAARVTVLSGGARTLPVSVDGQPPRQDRSNVIPARANVVSQGYLDAMGIPVVRGRTFLASDGPTSPGVVIVSRSLANRLWPNADPVGQTLISMSRFEVVGVVPDTVYFSATERDPRPVFYLPLAQNYESGVTLHVRTAGDPLAMLPAVRQSVRDLDPRLALTRPRRLLDEFDRSMTTQRTMAVFVGLLGGIALLLVSVGLYGVIAYIDPAADGRSRPPSRAGCDPGVDPEPDRRARGAPHGDRGRARFRRRVRRDAVRAQSALWRRADRPDHLAGGPGCSAGGRADRLRDSRTPRHAHRSGGRASDVAQ